MRNLVALLLAGWLSAPLPSAGAPPAGPLESSADDARGVALDFGPPPDSTCPDEAALRDDVARLLGRDPFRAEAERRFVVRWHRLPDGMAADLTVVDAGAERGARRLVSAPGECPALHRAIGLMLALALDPLRLAEPLPAAVVEAPIAAAPPADEPPIDASPIDASPIDASPTDASPTEAPTTPGVALSGRLGLGATWGITPDLGVGGALGARIGGSRFAVGVAARGVLPSATAFAGGEVQAALLGLSLDGCAALGPVELCALAIGGWQPAGGDGFVDEADLDALYLAGGLALAAPIALDTRWGLRPVLEVLAPITETRLRIGDAEAWRTPAVNGAAGIELTWR